jgi:hypothetical protein
MSAKLILRLFLALLITLVAAYYQRKTGPTHAIHGEKSWQGVSIKYILDRSHGGETDQPVSITVSDTTVTALLVYRRFKTGDNWTGMLMKKENPAQYIASIPHQPPAAKIEYFILFSKQDQFAVLPEEKSVVTRFKGDVPVYVLLPHILLMFLAMFLSNAAGLEALVNGELMIKFSLWATVCLFLGGMILGPIVQKFAFEELWTGVPFGFDLTDNKALFAMVFWFLAVWKGRGNRPARAWIITAALILLLVYMIPHSLMGSELNYQTMKIETGK